MNHIKQKAESFFKLLEAGENYSVIMAKFKELELLLLANFVQYADFDETIRQEIGALLRELVDKMREYEKAKKNYYFTSVKLLEIFCIKNEL